MTVKITIRDKATGNISEYMDALSDENTLEESFWWSEGNMACDCNRALAFSNHKYSAPCYDESYKDGRFEIIKWEKQ